MAKTAIASRKRAEYEVQEAAWRKIAELLELNEADRKKQPRWWPFSLRSVVGGALGRPLRK